MYAPLNIENPKNFKRNSMYAKLASHNNIIYLVSHGAAIGSRPAKDAWPIPPPLGPGSHPHYTAVGTIVAVSITAAAATFFHCCHRRSHLWSAYDH